MTYRSRSFSERVSQPSTCRAAIDTLRLLSARKIRSQQLNPQQQGRQQAQVDPSDQRRKRSPGRLHAPHTASLHPLSRLERTIRTRQPHPGIKPPQRLGSRVTKLFALSSLHACAAQTAAATKPFHVNGPAGLLPRPLNIARSLVRLLTSHCIWLNSRNRCFLSQSQRGQDCARAPPS